MLITGNELAAKSGVRVGEYGPAAADQDKNAVVGYVEPAGKSPSWILYFTAKGDASLYTNRESSGAIVGEGITLKAKGGNPEFVPKE